MSIRSTADSEAQVMEEFWGVELTKEKKTTVWDEKNDEGEDSSLFISNNLEIRQACLGIGAKEGERNVVQVSVEDDAGKSSNFTILSLRLGGTEQCTLFLNLQPPVTFKLVQGNGPISIVGQTTETMSSPFDSSDDESDEMEELSKVLISKKRPATTALKQPAKMNKKDPDDTSFSKSGTDDFDDDDDEMDDDMEDEDDDDEEDEDEEEEGETEHVSKKTQINGKNGKKSKALVKGEKMSKTMSDKKKKPSTEGHDIEQIKESLLKMSVPKKISKFNNFLGNSFKIKDDNVKKQLWEHVQKSRPQK